MSRHLKSYEIDELCTAYAAGETSVSLAHKLGVSAPAICMWLRKRNIERRNRSDAATRHTLNEQAFDTITDESAYWIGFLMADGSINHRSGAPEIALVLSSKDIGHIQLFRHFLGSTHAITNVPTTQAVRFAVRSHKLVAALERYGIVSNKSFTARVIELENNLHFWRGVIDGDGYINVMSNDRYRLELVGSQALLLQFTYFVQSICPACCVTVRPCRRIFRVGLSGQYAKVLIHYLYPASTIALERKYQLVQL